MGGTQDKDGDERMGNDGGHTAQDASSPHGLDHDRSKETSGLDRFSLLPTTRKRSLVG